MSNIPTAISVQIDKEDKEKVTKILQKLGISMSGLINMTIKQVIMREALPFEVSIPQTSKDDIYNYFTKEELKETAKELAYIEEHPEEYKGYNNVNDLFKDLNNDD